MRSLVVPILSCSLAAAAVAQVAPPSPQMAPVRRMRMAAPPPAYVGDTATAPLTFSRAAPVVASRSAARGRTGS